MIGKTSGMSQPDYGCTLDTLAKLVEGQGRVTEAEPLYRQALAILEKSLGPEDASVATSRENLGGLLKSQGKLDEAEQLLKHARATKEQIFGKNHPNLLKTLSQLGDLYRLEGKADLANELFKTAGEIQKDALVEVKVFFATDRAPVESGKTGYFGGTRAETLTFGQAAVVVPKPQAGVRPLRVPAQADAELAVTEVTRLAMHDVSVPTDAPAQDRLWQRAAVQLGTATGAAVVFVHGYNVDFENGLLRAGQIAYDIKFDGPMFLFSWTSRDYRRDSNTVTIGADHLANFVRTIAGKTKVRKIHFVAHSMGNMVLLLALKQISNDPALRPLIGEVIDAAPDVDDEVFAHTVKSIKDAGGGSFTLYASHWDLAVWVSSLVNGFTRAGFIDENKPLITPGVETIDVTSAGAGWLSWFSLNHDVYASNPVLVADMKQIIENGVHPPDKRPRQFESVKSKDGTYWQFRRKQVAAAPIETGAAASPPPLSPPPVAPVPADAPTPVNVPPAPQTAEPAPAPAPENTNTSTPGTTQPANPKAAMVPPAGGAEPPAQPSPPSSAAASPAVPPAKVVQRKKHVKRTDPEWNTHPLER